MELDLAELSVLDPARGREPDSFERLRSEAALDRIIEGPRHRPVLRRTLIGATAAAVAVGAALVVPSLFPSAADKAFASWTATPTPVTGQQVLPDARACVSGYGIDPAAVVAGDVIVAEQRGTATSMILKAGSDALECMSVDHGKVFASQRLPGAPIAPANGIVSVETQSSVGDGSSQYSHIVGFTGPGVSEIDVLLPGGRTVHTSAAAGWWTAWWPGPEGGEADTVRIAAHTSHGSAVYRAAELGG